MQPAACLGIAVVVYHQGPLCAGAVRVGVHVFVDKTFGSEEIIRVRLGIGEDEIPDDKAGFVLSEFPAARGQDLNEMIRRAADAVRITVSEGVEKARSACNA